MTIDVWDSGLGASVRHGRLFMEVWQHGGVSRLVGDDSLTTYYRTHHAKVPRGSWEEMAAAAVKAWNEDRARWQPCE